jgi:hypothetical protein
VKELVDNGLLMEGKAPVTTSNFGTPAIYRGFQMVNEDKLRNLRDDTVHRMTESGLLPLLRAHFTYARTMSSLDDLGERHRARKRSDWFKIW